MQYVDLGYLPKVEKKSKKKRLFKFTLLTLLLGIVIYAGYVLYWPAATLINQIVKKPSAVLSLIRNPEGELKDTDGRTNFLMVGIDKRANIPYSYQSANGEVRKNGFLTDTIVVFSVEQETKKVAMVSIPRDTWVTVNGGGIKTTSAKINAVYSIGNANKYPKGGMSLLAKEIEEIVGLPIHYSIRVDFEGFRQGIDTLGGVDVVVEKSFDDYQYPVEGKESVACRDGGYGCRFEHLRFSAGKNHFDGDTALKFVRSRKGTNGEGSDFARAARQQKVLLAAREKALSLDNLADPVKLNNLFKEFGQAIETDLDVSNLVALYNLGKEINNADFKSLVLDNSTENFLYTPPSYQYGGYVLLPRGGNWKAVHQAVENLFNSSTTTAASND